MMNSYNKSTLAKRYFPNAKTKSAVRHLMNWIKRCTPLNEELKRLGYSKYNKCFTTKEIEMISEYLGDP